MMNNDAIRETIRTRKTAKVIAHKPWPVKPFDSEFVEALVESAFYAPFHYSCSSNHQADLVSPLPWRFYILDSQSCRELAITLEKQGLKTGKILGMLNAADYLFQTTWCPVISDAVFPKNVLFEGSLVNMEHIAAAGSAVQNMLLTATAKGYENYWSSGGILRDAEVFRLLGIPSQEILLGSVFIFPSKETAIETADYLPGKRRELRGNVKDCYRVIQSIPH